MPKISTYPLLTHSTLTGADYLLGDAASGPTTKRITITELMLSLGTQLATALTTTGNLVAGYVTPCDTTSAGFTATLPSPAALSSGALPFVVVSDAAGKFDTNNLTVAPNGGEKIAGVTGNFVISARNATVVFQSDGTNWLIGTAANYPPFAIKTGDYTLTLADGNGTFLMSSTGNHTFTIDSNANTPHPIGTRFFFGADGNSNGKVTIASAGDSLSLANRVNSFSKQCGIQAVAVKRTATAWVLFVSQGAAGLATTLQAAGNLAFNQLNPCDTNAIGAFTATLPDPTICQGQTVVVYDSAGKFNTNNLTVAPFSGEKIGGLASNYICSTLNGVYGFTSDGTNWLVSGSVMNSALLNSGGGVTSLFSIFATTGNTGTSATVLTSQGIGAGLLGANGNTVIFKLRGKFANNSHTKQLQLYFGPLGTSGDTLAFDSGALSATGSGIWNIYGEIIKDATSGEVQIGVTMVNETTGLTTVATTVDLDQRTIGSLTLTNNQFITLVATAGAGGANNDITLTMGKGLFAP